MSELSIKNVVAEALALDEFTCCGSANFFRGIIVGNYRKSQALLKSYLDLPPVIPEPNPAYILEVLEGLQVLEDATIDVLNQLSSGKCNSQCCSEASRALLSISDFMNTIATGAMGSADPQQFQTGIKVIRDTLLNSIKFIQWVACCEQKSCCTAIVSAVGLFYRNIDPTKFMTLTLVEAVASIEESLLHFLYLLLKKQCCCDGSAQGLTLLASASLDNITHSSHIEAVTNQFKQDAKSLICAIKC